ncbi:MAG: hypothetical protein JXA39_01405 [Bacteroidales bacterium]|nr:hypothetical protein [Bacteroidales bacterium]
MKKIRKLTIGLLTAIILSTTLTSCMTTKTSVGAFKESPGLEYTYAKGKQFWIFWGIIPIGRTSVNTPGNGNCQVTTRFTLVDVLISGLTGGIITSYTIKVEAKR